MNTSTLVADPAADRVACAPRTAFVLAGGAALGAMQARMIHALYERLIAPDLLIGTSVGALVRGGPGRSGRGPAAATR